MSTTHIGNLPTGTQARRGFLALIGAATVTGSVLFRKAVAEPTLILPPSTPLETMPGTTAGAADYPLLSAYASEMSAICRIKGRVPDREFREWLEQGLRSARFYDGRDEATMERLAEEAVVKHGGVFAAMRAGAFRAVRA